MVVEYSVAIQPVRCVVPSVDNRWRYAWLALARCQASDYHRAVLGE